MHKMLARSLVEQQRLNEPFKMILSSRIHPLFIFYTS